MQTWLNKPYPLVARTRDKWLLVFGFSVFTYLFLLLYQPYGAANIPGKSWYLLGFGGSVLSALSFNYFLLPLLLTSWFDPSRWQVRKEILYISWSFCLITVLNYLYNATVGKNLAPQFGLAPFLGITFSVGIFPLLALIFFTEKYLSERNRNLAGQLNRERKPVGLERSGLSVANISGETLQDGSLTLEVENFLFAVAAGNYTTFYYLENGQVEKRLLRISLRSASEQLAGIETIIRCHRSYLVNKSKITEATGNARSLNVRLENYDGLIPISRSFSRDQLF